MILYALAVTGGVSLGVALLLLLAHRLYVGTLRIQAELSPPRNGDGEALAARIAALETKVEALPSLWEEERERAERARERARAHERSARKKLEEFEDEPDAHQELRLVDGQGSGAQGVLPLPSGMEGNGPPAFESVEARAAALGFDAFTLATGRP